MSGTRQAALAVAAASVLIALAYALFLTFTGLPYYLSSADAAQTERGPAADEAPAALRAGALLAESPGGAASLGGYLADMGLNLAAADRVWPRLDLPLLPGTTLWVERTIPFSLILSGQRFLVRGQGSSVGEALASAGIYLVGRDYTQPGTDALLQAYQTIVVNRVLEAIEIQQDTTSFQTEWQPDPELELDGTRVAREGQEGIALWRYKLTYVNGEQVERRLEDSWIEQEPLDRLMAYGTQVVLRSVETSSGSQEYWRRVRVYATSYSASTAGVSRSAPNYGITRTGKQAGTGIIAVDPTVIALGTRIYVPGYGIGVAEDTGGGVKGRWLDLCYDDADLVLWHRWLDVYLLTPAPPEGAIRYVLPDWPRER